MTTKKRWRQHLNELMGSSMDPVVYALRWARDPRCIQNGSGHRRVGRVMSLGSSPVCALWAGATRRVWE